MTSVFGGYYDIEFEDFTIPLFASIQKEEFILLFSKTIEKQFDAAKYMRQQRERLSDKLLK